MLKFILTVIFLIASSLIAVGCSAKQEPTKPILVEVENREGVILFVDGLSTWLPDIEMVTEFENGLEEYLVWLSNGKHRDDDEKLNFIMNNLEDYKRQYIGTGSKTIYCNFLLDGHDYWTQSWVEVSDGGAAYFQIKYKAGRYFGLTINGEA